MAMTGLDIAALVAAVAFAALVGFLIPVLIRLKNTVAESERVIVKLNADLPFILGDLREVTAHVSDMTGQARDGVEHMSQLLHKAGRVGEMIQQANRAVENTSNRLLSNAAGIMAGVRAGLTVVRRRMFLERLAHPPLPSFEVRSTRPPAVPTVVAPTPVADVRPGALQ